MAISTGLLAATAAAGPSAQAAGNGTATASISGVPGSLPVGGGFEATISVVSTSPYRISVDDLYVSTYPVQSGAAPTAGVSVQWQDPATGAWRASDQVNAFNGGYGLIELGKVVVQPNSTLTYHVRVSMDDGAARGSWRFMTNGISGYSLLKPDGSTVDTALDNYNLPQTTFRYGSAAAPAPATPSPSPTHPHPSAAAPTPTPTHTRPPTAAPTHSRTPTPSPTSAAPVALATPAAPPASEAPPVPTPSAPPASPTTAAPSPSPSPSPSSSASVGPTAVPLTKTAAASTSGVNPWAVGTTAALLAALGAGAALLVRHRRRASQD
ncbi:hypothetical protein ACFYNO_00835 [Kitasatospora sp. NPDC006697]|uniref:hypothetical protein n=1 Tax=Kitasatospora sp. NPDC006697 TaxID=3364020 RepID=UPI00368A5897